MSWPEGEADGEEVEGLARSLRRSTAVGVKVIAFFFPLKPAVLPAPGRLAARVAAGVGVAVVGVEGDDVEAEAVDVDRPRVDAGPSTPISPGTLLPSPLAASASVGATTPFPFDARSTSIALLFISTSSALGCALTLEGFFFLSPRPKPNPKPKFGAEEDAEGSALVEEVVVVLERCGVRSGVCSLGARDEDLPDSWREWFMQGL